MQLIAQLFCATMILAFAVGQPAIAGDLERRQAKRIHDRLTGVPATNATIDAMETALGTDSSGKSAAAIAILNPSFYNVTLKNFATPWSNEEQTVFAALNDYTATVIGMIRDDIDFRDVLYGDILYTGNNTPAYANDNNDHYEALENLGPVLGNLANTGILQARIQSNVTGLTNAATAGVITSRAAAKSFFSDGTNRAMFRFTLINHLCTDLEPLKDISRTPDRIRQDVSRSPGGDSRLFLNSCVGCHAGMDAMAGAYAYYEYEYTNNIETGQLSYTPGSVQGKHLINPDNFKPGRIMTDDSWVNYWRKGQNGVLAVRSGSSVSGWTHTGEVLDDKGNAVGNGAKSLGIELANSKAFAQCQVDKVFKSVCFRDPNHKAADRATRNTVVDTFVAGGYKMKQVFGDVAAACKGN
jgi:hypothetical protein